MGYCAILIPQDLNKQEEKDVGFLDSITGKLMSGVDSGGLSFDNVTTVMKNTANLLIEGKDTLANNFAGIALVQLLTQGKITNETAFQYLTQGFPKALNQSAIALGFQSIEQLKTALKSENGVNVQQFIKAFENAGTAISNFLTGQESRRNVEGFDVIEIDAVLSDSRSYASETPDRRVQSGQTYQEYIHNLPDMFNLECVIQDGRNYNGDEFEDILLNLRDRKIAVNIIFGEAMKENICLTNFNPIRENLKGYKYSLEFKKIKIGSFQLVPLNIKIAQNIQIVKNELYPQQIKTEQEVSNGYKSALDETLDTSKEWINLVLAGKDMNWGDVITSGIGIAWE